MSEKVFIITLGKRITLVQQENYSSGSIRQKPSDRGVPRS